MIFQVKCTCITMYYKYNGLLFKWFYQISLYIEHFKIRHDVDIELSKVGMLFGCLMKRSSWICGVTPQSLSALLSATEGQRKEVTIQREETMSTTMKIMNNWRRKKGGTKRDRAFDRNTAAVWCLHSSLFFISLSSLLWGTIACSHSTIHSICCSLDWKFDIWCILKEWLEVYFKF